MFALKAFQKWLKEVGLSGVLNPRSLNSVQTLRLKTQSHICIATPIVLSVQC